MSYYITFKKLILQIFIFRQIFWSVSCLALLVIMNFLLNALMAPKNILKVCLVFV